MCFWRQYFEYYWTGNVKEHELTWYIYREEDLPVSGHEDQGVDGDVGGDVDDILGGPVHGHRVSKVSGDI